MSYMFSKTFSLYGLCKAKKVSMVSCFIWVFMYLRTAWGRIQVCTLCKTKCYLLLVPLKIIESTRRFLAPGVALESPWIHSLNNGFRMQPLEQGISWLIQWSFIQSDGTCNEATSNTFCFCKYIPLIKYSRKSICLNIHTKEWGLAPV